MNKQMPHSIEESLLVGRIYFYVDIVVKGFNQEGTCKYLGVNEVDGMQRSKIKVKPTRNVLQNFNNGI